jgi:hypothetical protein
MILYLKLYTSGLRVGIGYARRPRSHYAALSQVVHHTGYHNPKLLEQTRTPAWRGQSHCWIMCGASDS